MDMITHGLGDDLNMRTAMLFQDPGWRQVMADFSGGLITSDGGALPLRQGTPTRA
jgi:hypothetical protein